MNLTDDEWIVDEWLHNDLPILDPLICRLPDLAEGT
jgi:hypothetical protein